MPKKKKSKMELDMARRRANIKNGKKIHKFKTKPLTPSEALQRHRTLTQMDEKANSFVNKVILGFYVFIFISIVLLIAKC